MEDFFNYIAPLLAVFFIWKLYSVLGTRNDADEKRTSQNKPTNKKDNIIQFVPKNKTTPPPKIQAKIMPKAKAENLPSNFNVDTLGKKYEKVLGELQNLEPNFSFPEFIVGAKAAYEMIITAFAKGELATLKNLLENNLYKTFENDIATRQKNNEKMKLKFIGIEKCEIIDLTIENSNIQITVKFISQMVSALYDAQENIKSGTEDKISEIKDIWTFERQANSENPNWQLTATK